MAVKFRVASLEGMSEELKKEYVQQSDGSYVLDVEGAVDKNKVTEFRDNNIQLKQLLEKFNGIDPVLAKEAIAFKESAKDKQLFDDGKIEEVVTGRMTKMREEYDTRISALTEGNTTLSRQLESLLIDSAVRSEAAKASVIPTAIDDVLLRAKTVFRIKDGNATPFNEKGEVIYGKDGISPMTISEYLTGLGKTAPHLFPGHQGGGAPRGGGAGGGSVDTSKMSATQKIAAGLAAQGQ